LAFFNITLKNHPAISENHKVCSEQERILECGEGGVAQLFFHISLQLRAHLAALLEESTTTLPIGAGIQSANQ